MLEWIYQKIKVKFIQKAQLLAEEKKRNILYKV